MIIEKETSKSLGFRKTKIICTIGPATSPIDKLRALTKEGMNIARINMSHSSQDQAYEIIKSIRTINRKTDYPVAVLLDTQGPEIRTGEMKGSVNLKVGDEIEISVRDADIENQSTIYVNYQDIVKELNEGDRVTLDNGLINLDVISKSSFGLKCLVVDGGLLKSRRHVNLPGIRVNLPSITSKDESDILFAIQNDVDFIALSFVRSAADIEECQRIIKRHRGHSQVIAKIEDHFGAKNHREIISAANGMMVARGDLGVEIPFEELPVLQRKMVRACAEEGKRCIIATHLLESMIEHPMPTRAEVTDVSNAVYEEADAVMLSGETSVGKYPIKAVGVLNKICKRIEHSGGLNWAKQRKVSGIKPELARAAVELADSLRANGIIVITRRGIMADHVSSFHPHFSPIFAFTNMSTVRRKLMLYRGMFPLRIDFSNDPEKTIQTAFRLLINRKILQTGDVVVIVSDILAGENRVDAVQVRRLEEVKTISESIKSEQKAPKEKRAKSTKPIKKQD